MEIKLIIWIDTAWCILKLVIMFKIKKRARHARTHTHTHTHTHTGRPARLPLCRSAQRLTLGVSWHWQQAAAVTRSRSLSLSIPPSLFVTSSIPSTLFSRIAQHILWLPLFSVSYFTIFCILNLVILSQAKFVTVFTAKKQTASQGVK